MLPHPAVLLSQLLDLHLSRCITRYRTPTMSKFKALADAVRGDMENLNQQADELFAERELLRRSGEEIMSRYREHHKETREGLDAMRQAIADLSGSNSQGNVEGERKEGSTVLQNTFPGGERGQQ